MYYRITERKTSYLPKINNQRNGCKSRRNIRVIDTKYGAGYTKSGDEEEKNDIKLVGESHDEVVLMKCI